VIFGVLAQIAEGYRLLDFSGEMQSRVAVVERRFGLPASRKKQVSLVVSEYVPGMTETVVLQVSNADKFVAERLSCVLRLPTRKGCR
jgi:hypothetical protein